MAKIDWAKALADYLKEETMSYASIASKYGVSLQAVKKRLSRGFKITVLFNTIYVIIIP